MYNYRSAWLFFFPENPASAPTSPSSTECEMARRSGLMLNTSFFQHVKSIWAVTPYVLRVSKTWQSFRHCQFYAVP